MIDELKQLEQELLSPEGLAIAALETDQECVAYYGFNFSIGNERIKFRKANTTPTKVGLFVTLWQRNGAHQTIPFNINDAFDYYFIYVEQDSNRGVFIFNRTVLATQHILSTPTKEGKRGFRVYPPWVKMLNKQAEKTQSWQVPYFIAFTVSMPNRKNQFKKLFDTQNI